MSPSRLASLFSAAVLMACVALPAAAHRQIGFDAYALPGSGTVAVPVREGDINSGAFADLDAATSGALSRAVAAAEFKGRAESKLDLPGIAGFDRVLLVGVGKDEVTPRVLEDFGGLVGQMAAGSSAPRVDVLWRGDEANAASHIAFGAALGSYRFDKYRSSGGDDEESPRAGHGDLVVRTPAGAAAASDYESQWKPVAEAVAFDKGCYLGQEVMARLRSMGRPPHLAHPPHADLRVESKWPDVGTVTERHGSLTSVDSPRISGRRESAESERLDQLVGTPSRGLPRQAIERPLAEQFVPRTLRETATGELADITGESMSQAVTVSIRERRDRLRDADQKPLAERLLEIGRSVARRLPEEMREGDPTAHLYDERGLPR